MYAPESKVTEVVPPAHSVAKQKRMKVDEETYTAGRRQPARLWHCHCLKTVSFPPLNGGNCSSSSCSYACSSTRLSAQARRGKGSSSKPGSVNHTKSLVPVAFRRQLRCWKRRRLLALGHALVCLCAMGQAMTTAGRRQHPKRLRAVLSAPGTVPHRQQPYTQWEAAFKSMGKNQKLPACRQLQEKDNGNGLATFTHAAWQATQLPLHHRLPRPRLRTANITL